MVKSIIMARPMKMTTRAIAAALDELAAACAGYEDDDEEDDFQPF